MSIRADAAAYEQMQQHTSRCSSIRADAAAYEQMQQQHMSRCILDADKAIYARTKLLQRHISTYSIYKAHTASFAHR